MRQLLGFVSALALLATPIASQAATFTFDHATVTMRGQIVAGDGAQLDRFLSAGHNNGHPLTTLVLDSPGGLVVEGIALADAVHAFHVDTAVPDNGICASACFLPFAAGDHMKVGRDAKIGIHSATTTHGAGPDDGNGTLLMARYAAQLEVPSAIVGRMVVTDSIYMTWLDEAELKGMGVGTPVHVNTARPQGSKEKGCFSWLFGGGSRSNNGQVLSAGTYGKSAQDKLKNDGGALYTALYPTSAPRISFFSQSALPTEPTTHPQ